MKKITFILLTLALVFASCEKKDEEIKKTFKLDPLATVNIKPDKSAWRAFNLRAISDNPKHLSPLDIVKKATVIQFYNPLITNSKLERGFAKGQKDTISSTPALKMWATDIINEKGEYVSEFIAGHNMILIHFSPIHDPEAIRDTIGYIPNSVMRTAESAIKEAYNANNPEEVLRLFNEAFTFRPITGSEYASLKAQGNQ